jgi:hypothetical protein
MAIRNASEESISHINAADKSYRKSSVSIPSKKVADGPSAVIVGTPTDVGTNRAFNNASVTIPVTASNTGGAVTSFTATSTPGSITGTSTTSPITITGLNSNTSYTFSVVGSNTSAVSPAAITNSVTATSVPDIPTIGTVTDVGTNRAKDNGAANVPFTAPTNSGGKSITAYTATSNPGSFSSTSTTSPIVVTGLASGTAYTYTVTAKNDNGTSVASSASSSVTATTVPGAPTSVAATAGDTTASVTFTAPVYLGPGTITYTVTSSPDAKTGTGTASPISVTGLTDGTAYTFTVTAANDNGTSAASTASNSVTPAAPYYAPYYAPYVAPYYAPYVVNYSPPFYAPVTGGCWLYDSQVLMADGTTKPIQDIAVGDVLLAPVIPTYPNGENISLWYPANVWSTSSSDGITYEPTTVTVVTHHIEKTYYNFNNKYEITGDHFMFAKKNGVWQFERGENLLVGDYFMDKDNNEVEITSIVFINEPASVVDLTVFPNALFVANGVITHNVKG